MAVIAKAKKCLEACAPGILSSYELVRLAFEPTTPWFVAKYSIQLSYSREASDYSSNREAVLLPAPTLPWRAAGTLS
jgi:hypothetical protein